MTRPIKDLTGKVFSNWTATEYAGKANRGRSLWRVVCKCGTEKVLPYDKLVYGLSKSCGCLPKGENIEGMRFGLLTAIRKTNIKCLGGVCWECVCDCGGTKTVQVGQLKRGAVRSCGCLATRGPGVAMRNATINGYKNSAKKRGYDWLISDKAALNIMSQNCRYCGRPPSNRMETKASNGGFTYTGIDRVDNSIGYVDGNVVPCCGMCNRAKNDRTELEFYEWVKAVFANARLGVENVT